MNPCIENMSCPVYYSCTGIVRCIDHMSDYCQKCQKCCKDNLESNDNISVIRTNTVFYLHQQYEMANDEFAITADDEFAISKVLAVTESKMRIIKTKTNCDINMIDDSKKYFKSPNKRIALISACLSGSKIKKMPGQKFIIRASKLSVTVSEYLGTFR